MVLQNKKAAQMGKQISLMTHPDSHNGFYSELVQRHEHAFNSPSLVSVSRYIFSIPLAFLKKRSCVLSLGAKKKTTNWDSYSSEHLGVISRVRDSAMYSQQPR